MDYNKLVKATMETMSLDLMGVIGVKTDISTMHVEYYELNGFGFVFYTDTKTNKRMCDVYEVDEYSGIQFADVVPCGKNGKFEIYWNYMTAMPETRDSIKNVYMKELEDNKELENQSFAEFLEELTDMGGDIAIIYSDI